MTASMMRRRRTGISTALTIGIVVIAGCSSDDESDVAGAAPTQQTQEAQPTYGVPDYEDPDGRPRGSPGPNPTWDTNSRGAAERAAEEVMRAFSRPDASHEEWWAELGSLLSPDAQQDYIHVDPANIPVRNVTGPGRLVDERSAWLAQVEVPTDAGTYTVMLSRTDAEAEWLADRIQPPEDEDE